MTSLIFVKAKNEIILDSSLKLNSSNLASLITIGLSFIKGIDLNNNFFYLKKKFLKIYFHYS